MDRALQMHTVAPTGGKRYPYRYKTLLFSPIVPVTAFPSPSKKIKTDLLFFSVSEAPTCRLERKRAVSLFYREVFL